MARDAGKLVVAIDPIIVEAEIVERIGPAQGEGLTARRQRLARDIDVET